MSDGLVDQYRNAKRTYPTGGISLVCLDDASLDQSEYGTMGKNTVVPRSREEGGIMGLSLGADCKYGSGVKRRKLGDDGNGGFQVEQEIDNFRPDHAAAEMAAEADLFSEESLANAGIEIAEETPVDAIRKQARDMMSAVPAPTSGQQTPQSGQAPDMMQMMQMLLAVATNQSTAAAPAPVTPPAPVVKKAPAGKNVTFAGNFGKITVRYTDVQIETDFVVLISSPEQPTMYEPPLSSSQTIELTVGGSKYTVVNLGLSFSYKGDILLLMPLALNSETDDAEEK